MVAIGINSALVMVALVLNRTACRRPGSRDDNYSYYFLLVAATSSSLKAEFVIPARFATNKISIMTRPKNIVALP
jgi:hypothetical protein